MPKPRPNSVGPRFRVTFVESGGRDSLWSEAPIARLQAEPSLVTVAPPERLPLPGTLSFPAERSYREREGKGIQNCLRDIAVHGFPSLGSLSAILAGNDSEASHAIAPIPLCGIEAARIFDPSA
jgi:hypothetical protein